MPSEVSVACVIVMSWSRRRQRTGAAAVVSGTWRRTGRTAARACWRARVAGSTPGAPVGGGGGARGAGGPGRDGAGVAAARGAGSGRRGGRALAAASRLARVPGGGWRGVRLEAVANAFVLLGLLPAQ